MKFGVNKYKASYRDLTSHSCMWSLKSKWNIEVDSVLIFVSIHKRLWTSHHSSLIFGQSVSGHKK